jgi:hypothetical protein
MGGPLLAIAASLDATKIVHIGLAPFVAVGTITSICVALAAFGAKAEASAKGWPTDMADAYLQAMINEGVAVGAAISFWPVAVLIADAVT